MNEEELKRLQEEVKKLASLPYHPPPKPQSTTDQADTDNLTITFALCKDLIEFERRRQNGYIWLHFVDYAQQFDLMALVEQGFVEYQSEYGKKTDGVNEYFPQSKYELTMKGRMILANPRLYISDPPELKRENPTE